MEIWGLKACDTCRKAKKELEGAGHDVRLRDVRDEPLSDVERGEVLAAFGDKALNTRSTTWRGLSEDERAGDPAVLLAAHPALMKRPVIRAGGAMHLGWGPDVKAALGLG